LIAIVFVAAQGLSLITYLLLIKRAPDRAAADAVVRSLGSDGTFLSLCTFTTLLVCVPLIMGIAKLKRGSKLRDYLELKWPPLKQVLRWTLITLGFCLLADGISLLLSQPLVPEFMLKAYRSASPRWLLWLALVIAAPIFEEICFRGFIFRGFAASRLRWQGATIITAALWAVIHLQYDWYLISVVFGLGLVLGTARAMTNSTLLTIWLHGLINALATAQVAFMLLQQK
jgi:membrane protease YdiL (CAAX protease family)